MPSSVIVRNSNVELLRCLLMALIVLGHCRHYGIFSMSESWPIAIFTLSCRWHVDSFVAISGWFGIKFRWDKVLRLVGVLVFYSVLSWLYCGRVGEVSGGWFGGTYLMLMFMAPLINAGVEGLMEKSPGLAWSAWLAFAAGMTLNWLPYHAFTGCAPVGGGSHTLLTMMFVYVTARMVSLSKSPFLERRILHFGIPVAVCVIILGGGLSLINYVRGIPPTWNNVKWITDYDSPATWGIALMLVVFFVRKIRLPSWLDKTASFLAPSMFGVYLLHETTAFGHEIFRVPQSWMLEHWQLSAGVAILASAIITFVAGVVVDLMRRGFVGVVRQLLVKVRACH